jgi:hypothetical protein
MKSKRSVITIVVLFAAIVLWWLWPRADGARTSGSDARPEIPVQDEIRAADQIPSPDLPESTITYFPPGSAHDPAAENYRRQQEAIERSLDEWRTPIRFYGKVVDETGQPIEGVVITFGVTDLSPEGHSTIGTESGADGLFFLQGVNGKHLSIKLYKPGYYVSRLNPAGFFYAGRNDNFVANPNQPVVFHLRKQGQGEPLITMDFPGFARIAQLPRNGTPVAFDLINGTTNTPSGGHIQFEFTGDPISRETKRFNWQLRITTQGGLLETHEEFPFSAPESGYAAEVEIKHPVTLEDAWQTTIERKYFIRLADGRYGRIEFRLMARNGVFTMLSYVNPTGSRDLEYSEAAQ